MSFLLTIFLLCLANNLEAQPLTFPTAEGFGKYTVGGRGGSVIIERYTYTPYGVTTILNPTGTTVLAESTIGNPYTYTSRRFDPETGLLRARMYASELGRFASQD